MINKLSLYYKLILYLKLIKRNEPEVHLQYFINKRDYISLSAPCIAIEKEKL